MLIAVLRNGDTPLRSLRPRIIEKDGGYRPWSIAVTGILLQDSTLGDHAVHPVPRLLD